MNLPRITVLLMLVLVAGIGYFLFLQNSGQKDALESASRENMSITSPAFQHNESIPATYTCDGGNIIPPLELNGVPNGTKSLVLIVDDPDAPRGTWIHWTLWNISPDTKTILENSLPPGTTEGITSFGKSGYGGPCPPSGTHRYFFKLYALDTMLDLTPDGNKAMLETTMEGHILGSAELIGLYRRS